jgi:hypothetical protein
MAKPAIIGISTWLGESALFGGLMPHRAHSGHNRRGFRNAPLQGRVISTLRVVGRKVLSPWQRKRDVIALKPRDDFSSNRHPALSFLFEHDLGANASRLSRGKTGTHFALTRPCGSGSCSMRRCPNWTDQSCAYWTFRHTASLFNVGPLKRSTGRSRTGAFPPLESAKVQIAVVSLAA